MSAQRARVVGVKISAGLGNQMFQYAAGLALAERLGAELICDIGHYRRHTRADRPLGLTAFGLQLQIGRIPPLAPLRHAMMVLGLNYRAFRRATVFQQRRGFEPAFDRLTAPVALSGYLQSWRYFEGHEASVRRAFDTSPLATAHSAALAAEIDAAQTPVAVHVRRGDYLKDEQSVARFGVLGTDYYQAARAALEARLPAGGKAPTYFLFSDEIERATKELQDWPGLRPVAGFSGHEDLRLMSLCRHFIIANSTFSWWGAWLGAAPDKQVVGPRRWFGPAHPWPEDIEDRLLPDWIRV